MIYFYFNETSGEFDIDEEVLDIIVERETELEKNMIDCF